MPISKPYGRSMERLYSSMGFSGMNDDVSYKVGYVFVSLLVLLALKTLYLKFSVQRKPNISEFIIILYVIRSLQVTIYINLYFVKYYMKLT